MFDSISKNISETKNKLSEQVSNYKDEKINEFQTTVSNIQQTVDDSKEKFVEAPKQFLKNVIGDQVSDAKAEIISGLTNGRNYWYGGFWPDYKFYLNNEHVIIALFGVSEYHPYSRAERLFVLVSSLFCSLFVVALMAHLECCVIENAAPKKRDAYLFVGSTILGLVITIYVKILRAFAECNCVSKLEGGCLKWICECFGHCAMFFFALPSIGLLFGSIFMIIADKDDTNVTIGRFILMFFVNQFASWVFGLFSGVIAFSWARCGQEEQFKEEKWHYWPDLENMLNATIPIEEIAVDNQNQDSQNDNAQMNNPQLSNFPQ